MDNATTLYRLLVILKAAVMAVMLCGCYGPQPGPDNPDPVRPRPHLPDLRPKPKPDPRPAGSVLSELADQIPDNINTSDALVLVVQLLKDGGDWTETDTQLLDQRLPGITEAKRALTKDDAAKLKGP